jgi:peptide-methionine (R)-S-oxide reductase
MAKKTVKSKEEWRQQLTPEQYRVTRQKGTERPFTGEYYTFKGQGKYQCVCCGNDLFESGTKYESGSGWPSFWAPVSEENVETERDTSHGMVRTEVMCSNCNAHLGHVFEDGPQPTGLRYCVNSASLQFVEENDAESGD